MESWSSISEGKDLVSDEISHTDSLTRNRNALLSWDLKSPCTFEAQNFWESGLPGILGKHVPSSFRSTISNTSLVSPSLFLGEDESSSKLPGSIVASNSRNSSLIDLNLGRLADNRDVYNSEFSKGASIFSSSKSSAPSKRMRASSGVYSVTAYCQVYGCNKDLSSSKEYHRRHKVCEVHSKTPKVIVKGIEQRFCQQCCRFQLLAEFDDGKRSCRKRLAGHNERRRKPQVALHSGRSGRFLQSYNGSCFPGTTLTAASFICQDILPSGILDLEYYGISDWCRRIKVEGSRQFKPLAGVPVTNAHLHLKPILSSYDVGKQYPTVYRNSINNVPTGSVLSDNGNHFLHDMRSSNSVSHSLYHESTLGSEVFNNVFITTASTVQGLSRIPDSGSAHSLLPSESQSSLSHSSEIPPARSLEMPVAHTHYSLSQVSDRLYGGSTQASASPMVISSGGGSETTIDLLQLSSQLQRVQDQQKSLQMKHENDAFCCLRIT